MIALIAIPHRLPASIHWYEDRAALESAALEYAAEHDMAEPDDYDDAVEVLYYDWQGHILVESADDLHAVMEYARSGKHQSHKVGALVREIREEFMVLPSNKDKRTLGKLTTTNEAGTHFTEIYLADWLRDMEMLGWITIDRPEHTPSGLAYDRAYWSVKVDEEVADWFDENGELIPAE